MVHGIEGPCRHEKKEGGLDPLSDDAGDEAGRMVIYSIMIVTLASKKRLN